VCGDVVYGNKRIFCADCAYMSKTNWAKEYQHNRDRKYRKIIHDKYYMVHRDEILLAAKTKRINIRLLINNHAN